MSLWTLLETLRQQAAGGPWTHLLIGLHEADPLLRVAKRYEAACYVTHVFLVCWRDGEEARTPWTVGPLPGNGKPMIGMKLIAGLVDVADVTPGRRDEMFALLHQHFDNVHRHRFEADLVEKRWVILVRDPATDRLRGFSTQTIVDATVCGRPVKALFSGDTIIHRECWGDRALSHVWGRLALATDRRPPRRGAVLVLDFSGLQDLSFPAGLLP